MPKKRRNVVDKERHIIVVLKCLTAIDILLYTSSEKSTGDDLISTLFGTDKVFTVAKGVDKD